MNKPPPYASPLRNVLSTLDEASTVEVALAGALHAQANGPSVWATLTDLGRLHYVNRLREALYTSGALLQDEAEHTDANFQARVAPWMQACFGEEISQDKVERADRLVEEVYELVRTSGYPRERAEMLLDFEYGRPVGEAAQEVGGVMVTLAAYCNVNGLDMHQLGEVELARVWTKVEQIREKQKSKPKGSPLPVPVPLTPTVVLRPRAPYPVDATYNCKREEWNAYFNGLSHLGCPFPADYNARAAEALRTALAICAAVALKKD